MKPIQSHTDLKELALQIIEISAEINSGHSAWKLWLPLARAAAHQPERWVDAFNQMNLGQQTDLLVRLRSPEAGVLAGMLLAILAKYASLITDEQAREFVLREESRVYETQYQALAGIQEMLSQHLSHIEQRLSPGFDLAQEIVRQEEKLAQLRLQEHEQNDRFARVHQLEQEILRLEARRRIVEAYNFEERLRYCAALRAQVEALEQRKRELETSIGELLGQRTALPAEVERLTHQLTEAQSQTQSQEERLRQLQQELEAARTRAQTAAQTCTEVETQLQQVRAKYSQLEGQIRCSKRRLREERRRLKELREAAARDGRAELEQELRKIYESLPDDQVDRDVRALRTANVEQANRREK